MLLPIASWFDLPGKRLVGGGGGVLLEAPAEGLRQLILRLIRQDLVEPLHVKLGIVVLLIVETAERVEYMENGFLEDPVAFLLRCPQLVVANVGEHVALGEEIVWHLLFDEVLLEVVEDHQQLLPDVLLGPVPGTNERC